MCDHRLSHAFYHDILYFHFTNPQNKQAGRVDSEFIRICDLHIYKATQTICLLSTGYLIEHQALPKNKMSRKAFQLLACQDTGIGPQYLGIFETSVLNSLPVVNHQSFNLVEPKTISGRNPRCVRLHGDGPTEISKGARCDGITSPRRWLPSSDCLGINTMETHARHYSISLYLFPGEWRAFECIQKSML